MELRGETKVGDNMKENTANVAVGTKPVWEKPLLEEVSERVMAQPYIRFT